MRLKNGPIAAGEQHLARAVRALKHHPKHVTILIAALLLGAGTAAFGVASLDPEPSNVTVRQVLETIPAPPLEEQVRELDLHNLNLFRTEATRASDTVEALLGRLGVHDPAAAAFLRREPTFRSQLLGYAGRNVTVEASERHTLLKLTGRWAPRDDGMFKRLLVERGAAGGFSARVETAPLVPTTRMGSATVHSSSLFAAADEAGIPDAVVGQIIDILSGDIDFQNALRSGDRFNVVYEALEADGEPLKTGRVLSVEFVNQGVSHEAVWFQEPGHKGGYYGMDGKSLQTSYLSSPVEFSRVTSGFAMRFSPILHEWKAHLGIDYAGGIGTPVRSVGDGLVEFAGAQNGFGNVVIIRHNSTEETVYAHLSRMDVQAGEGVTRGERIGAIGATGWVTGPHLHFEFRVNGVHRDPVQIARRKAAVILSAEAKPRFDQLARSMRAQLAAASGSAGAGMVASVD